jgi:hypothetical protein
MNCALYPKPIVIKFGGFSRIAMRLEQPARSTT